MCNRSIRCQFMNHTSEVITYHVNLVVLNMSHDIDLCPRVGRIALIVLVPFKNLVITGVVSKTIGDPILG